MEGKCLNSAWIGVKLSWIRRWRWWAGSGREMFEFGVDSSEIVVDSALEVVGRQWKGNV